MFTEFRKPHDSHKDAHGPRHEQEKKPDVLRDQEKELLEQMYFAHAIVHGTERRRKRHF